MKAVGYLQSLPVDHPEALLDLDLPAPTPGPLDLLVRVSAVSVNPVDTKVRRNRAPQPGQPEVLGWDAVGTVQAVGAAVQGFAVGDRVWYAGAINRPGSNAELQAVDHRIVSLAPRSLSDAEAAGLPLTAITAWELLFDRLGVPEGGGAGQTLLVTGAAGGVGSILVQLARQLTQLRVVGTASRPETQAWVRKLGAHAVVDHGQPLRPQLVAGGIAEAHYIASLTHSDQHWAQLVDLAAPQGRIGLIDDPATPLDVMALKRKALSLHWELMFTRSLFGTPDIAEQGKLLARVAQLIDASRLRSTVSEHFSPINAANLRRAHALLESGRMRGKLVLSGF
ncbi:zinc-binding alcohol dehydrogenase family protein [Roseateles asaccharophilus]|uniref:Zinc-type alcohol dehydrogenase-like protein n=1 Tax=Roseateles asaccharophilus TaxID=582607 RepID=A0ABU2AB65_9BURK|nr:zinc-binding alcohol dehydrogenase family protein [Roseateles asaccharophilus]MDR7334360.1 zinc-binding alcohol dehydrogenase family protein [Roseateles asaccharophilus]